MPAGKAGGLCSARLLLFVGATTSGPSTAPCPHELPHPRHRARPHGPHRAATPWVRPPGIGVDHGNGFRVPPAPREQRKAKSHLQVVNRVDDSASVGTQHRKPGGPPKAKLHLRATTGVARAGAPIAAQAGIRRPQTSPTHLARPHVLHWPGKSPHPRTPPGHERPVGRREVQKQFPTVHR